MKCLVCKGDANQELCDTCAQILLDKYPNESIWDIIKRYEEYCYGGEEE
ncbi:hypothetical protein HOA92_07610 [archaeon]|jgi:hypothetical protein|nr:hypothetical protein [archaeon]MBT6762879.1 hypothetical protein [archaeon]